MRINQKRGTKQGSPVRRTASRFAARLASRWLLWFFGAFAPSKRFLQLFDPPTKVIVIALTFARSARSRGILLSGAVRTVSGPVCVLSGWAVAPARLHKFEGIQRQGQRAVRVLVDPHHRLQVTQRGFLRSPAGGNDHLPQQIKREYRIRRLGVVQHDLREDEPGNILAGGSVDNPQVVPVAHQLRNLILVDVFARQGVVKTAVLVFFDD